MNSSRSLSLDIKLLVKFILIIVFAGLFLLSIYNDSIINFYSFLIFLNILLIIKTLKSPPFLLIFLFCFFYTLSLIPYYFFKIDISPWPDFNQYKYYNIVTRVYGIFLISSCLIDFENFPNFKKVYSFARNPNIIAFLFYSLICTLIIIFGQSGKSIFENGGYSIGDSSKSFIFEYFILFFALTYYFSTSSNFCKYTLLLLGVCFVGKSILYGGRIEMVELSLLVFYILTVNHKFKFSPLLIVLGCIIFYYLNLVIGSIRSNPIYLLEGRYSYYLNPFSNYSNFSGNYVSSNQGDVMQSSVRLIGLLENNFLSLIDRIKGLIGFVLSIVLPASFLPPEASLINYKKDIFNSGGGGLGPSYFYVYFSWIGPIIFASIVPIIYNYKSNTKSNYSKLYGIMVFSTFPRWLVYNPIILFKLCLWIMPIAFLSNVFFNYLKKHIKNES